MNNLKDYVDFLTSLVEMDEVKEGKFPLPKEIVYNVGLANHESLHREVLQHLGNPVNGVDLTETFEITILDVNLRFENE